MWAVKDAPAFLLRFVLVMYEGWDVGGERCSCFSAPVCPCELTRRPLLIPTFPLRARRDALIALRWFSTEYRKAPERRITRHKFFDDVYSLPLPRPL
jgi:hypothetical protein